MNFNIAGGTEQLYKRDIENQLGSIFHTSNYKKAIQDAPILNKSSSLNRKLYYNSNFDYWNDVFNRKIYNGSKLQLNGFHILEWLPQFPGLVHKLESKQLIEMAYKYGNKKIVNGQFIEFDPDGKGMFMRAGYGSLRFGTKIVRGQEYYLLSASSTGQSHEGIPLILSESIYHEVIKEIKNYYGIFADIIGTVKLVPNSENPILNWKNTPSYYLFVEKVFIKRESFEGETSVSIAVSYTEERTNQNDYKWSFKQFYPDSRDENLFSSVEWLKNYATRYLNTNSPHLIGDFDEFIPHFEKSDFELTKISNEIICSSKFDKYREEYYFDSEKILETEIGIFKIGDEMHTNVIGLISENKIKECLNYLQMHSLNEKMKNYIVLTKSRYAHLEKSNLRGIITMHEFDVYKNRITNSLLDTFNK